MDWVSIGGRIRRQREFLGYTREQFAELLRSILAEKFHILTSTGALNLQLFDCKYEDVRKAAVLQTLEAIFSKH